MYGAGHAGGALPEEEVARVVDDLLAGEDLDGKRVLIIVPDGTRTAPISKMFRLLHGRLAGRVSTLNFLIALGTHRPMQEDQINGLMGLEPRERETTFRDVGVFNH